MRLLDFYGSLSTDRKEIRDRAIWMRAAGFSQADVRVETLRAERALATAPTAAEIVVDRAPRIG